MRRSFHFSEYVARDADHFDPTARHDLDIMAGRIGFRCVAEYHPKYEAVDRHQGCNVVMRRGAKRELGPRVEDVVDPVKVLAAESRARHRRAVRTRTPSSSSDSSAAADPTERRRKLSPAAKKAAFFKTTRHDRELSYLSSHRVVPALSVCASERWPQPGVAAAALFRKNRAHLRTEDDAALLLLASEAAAAEKARQAAHALDAFFGLPDAATTGLKPRKVTAPSKTTTAKQPTAAKSNAQHPPPPRQGSSLEEQQPSTVATDGVAITADSRQTAAAITTTTTVSLTAGSPIAKKLILEFQQRIPLRQRQRELVASSLTEDAASAPQRAAGPNDHGPLPRLKEDADDNDMVSGESDGGVDDDGAVAGDRALGGRSASTGALTSDLADAVLAGSSSLRRFKQESKQFGSVQRVPSSSCTPAGQRQRMDAAVSPPADAHHRRQRSKHRSELIAMMSRHELKAGAEQVVNKPRYLTAPSQLAVDVLRPARGGASHAFSSDVGRDHPVVGVCQPGVDPVFDEKIRREMEGAHSAVLNTDPAHRYLERHQPRATLGVSLSPTSGGRPHHRRPGEVGAPSTLKASQIREALRQHAAKLLHPDNLKSSIRNVLRVDADETKARKLHQSTAAAAAEQDAARRRRLSTSFKGDDGVLCDEYGVPLPTQTPPRPAAAAVADDDESTANDDDDDEQADRRDDFFCQLTLPIIAGHTPTRAVAALGGHHQIPKHVENDEVGSAHDGSVPPVHRTPQGTPSRSPALAPLLPPLVSPGAAPAIVLLPPPPPPIELPLFRDVLRQVDPWCDDAALHEQYRLPNATWSRTRDMSRAAQRFPDSQHDVMSSDATERRWLKTGKLDEHKHQRDLMDTSAPAAPGASSPKNRPAMRGRGGAPSAPTTFEQALTIAASEIEAGTFSGVAPGVGTLGLATSSPASPPLRLVHFLHGASPHA